MEGTVRILKRFISATMIISVFILILNFILLGIWVFKGMNEGNSPAAVAQTVAEGLHGSSNSYSLDSSSEKLLNNLKTEATKEKQFNDIKGEYDVLKSKLLLSKKNDLQQHKPEVKQVLENEIASRYYFERGRYETNFKYDKELAQAIKTMQDKVQLASILKGEGNYKVIGKPVLAMAGKKAADKDTDDDDQ